VSTANHSSSVSSAPATAHSSYSSFAFLVNARVMMAAAKASWKASPELGCPDYPTVGVFSQAKAATVYRSPSVAAAAMLAGQSSLALEVSAAARAVPFAAEATQSPIAHLT